MREDSRRVPQANVHGEEYDHCRRGRHERRRRREEADGSVRHRFRQAKSTHGLKPAKNAPAGTRIAIIDKPDSTETRFLIGQPGIERTNPDRVALWIVNTLFGGRFTSILNDELRVNTGLTYGALRRFRPESLAGQSPDLHFYADGNDGKSDRRGVGVVEAAREKGITAEQLQSAKNYLKGTYPSEQLETADQMADILERDRALRLEPGEVDDLFSSIDAVTLEKANEVAKRLLCSRESDVRAPR